ncbi:MAG: PAS domain-containing protein [bacterium]
MGQPIELILMRQLAEYLVMPIFLVDPAGDLLFYNEPAEEMLGRRFDEAGPMPAAEWSTAFSQRDDDGAPIASDHLPLMIALRQHRPAHRTFWITGHDGVARRLGVTAFPLEGSAGRHLGAVALFWGVHDPGGQAAPEAQPALRSDGASPRQHAIEVIMMRHLAGYLAMPILLFDPEGNLLYYNKPAEAIYGRPLAESEMRSEGWVRTIPLFDEDGSPIPPHARPMTVALKEHHPVHRRLRISDLEGASRRIESTAFPLEGQGRRGLGGVVIFWELEPA